jgi:hypothetical protein
VVTRADIPELDTPWTYDATVALVKFAWWTFLGLISWAAVVGLWNLLT